ncbi:MAG: EFR1 family ferrodoxin [Lachnospirales bacterium]
MKILYFTGTGNSLYIAKKIGEQFNAELLSIPKLLNNEIFLIEDDVVGIVYPVYCLNLPNMLKEYLKKTQIKANYVFAISNCGMFSFSTNDALDAFIKVNYKKNLIMPDNFIYFDMKKSISKSIPDKKVIDEIANDIKNKVIQNKSNNVKRTTAKIIAKFTTFDFQKAVELFSISKECNNCGICAKVCVANNIEANNKVKFLNKCEQCMACIQNCPQKAIGHKKEKSSYRYRNNFIELKEIIQANDY